MRSLMWIALPLLLLSVVANVDVYATCDRAALTGSGSGSDTTAHEEAFERGFAAFEEGEYERSLEYLWCLIEQDPTFRDTEYGPAVYWYGRVLEALDRRDEAIGAWNAGLVVIDRFSMEMADAFVRSVFEEEKEEYYERAAHYYLQILSHVGEPLSEEDEEILDAHLLELCLILPEEVAASVGLDECGAEGDTPGVADDAAEQLIEWWNSENVNFATQRNERLEEHLERVGHARQEYWYDGALDDRGKTYIRYGPPEQHQTIRFDDIRDLHRSPGLASLVGRAFDGSRNEFWVYPAVDRAAHFLFIHDRNGAYRMARASELIPPGLRGSSRRAPDAVHVMEHVYRQLALYHIDYSTIYNEVANFSDELAFAQMGASRLPMSPSAFVQSTLGRARNEDHQIDYRRHERVPEAATSLHRYLEPLELAVRPVRFLEEDGTTRVDIYWAGAVRTLEPNRRTRRTLRRSDLPGETESYLLDGAVVTFNEDYSIDRHDGGRHRVPILEDTEPTDILSPLRYSMRMNDSEVDLGVQWDQYVVIENDSTEALEIGPKIKVQQVRVDSLAPLSADQGHLEMSDLMPLWLPDEGLAALEEDPFAYAYPYGDITDETDLALYFEVYHLEPDDDGMHRFSVEYEIARQSFTSLPRMILGEREDRTTVSSSYESTEPTAREYLAVELVEEDFLGRVSLLVRVRDEVSGEEVERVVPFSVIDPTRPARRW